MLATRKRYFVMVDGSHTECSDESTLCIGVLFHFEGGGVKMSLLGQSQNYDFFFNFRHNHKDEFE